MKRKLRFLSVFFLLPAAQAFAQTAEAAAGDLGRFLAAGDGGGPDAADPAPERPTGTWTYLVDEDQLGWGVGLLKGSNVGFAAGAAAFSGPLFVLTLLAKRLSRKRK